MKNIKNPEKIYIQLSDENDGNYGISICDQEPCNDNLIDPNGLNEEARERILNLLATAYKYINDKYYEHDK